MVGKISQSFKASTRNLDKAFKAENNSSITDFIDLEDILKQTDGLEVLVGIPEEKSQRKDSEGLTNAEIAFIHTHGVRTSSMIKDMKKDIDATQSYSKAYQMYIQSHGSPAYRIPPRPIIEPAIETYKEQISKKFQEAVKAYLEQDYDKGKQLLEQVGLKAQSYVRGWFTDPRNNWPPNSPATIKRKGSDKPLIDTGELRKSISYIVRDTKEEAAKKRKTAKVQKLKK